MSMSTISTVNSYFTALINNLMTIESRPLNALYQQKSDLEDKRSIFSTMSTKLSSMLTAVNNLTTDSADSSYEERVASISNISLQDGNVISASVQDTAVPGDYDISVTDLAYQHRFRSDQQLYSDQDLGISGTFVIGGADSRSLSNQTTVADTVDGFGTASITDGLKELGTDTYYFEVRDNSGVDEFRIVDSDGNAIDVDDASDGDSETTTDWQDLSLVEGTPFDTGRGLTFTVGSGPFTTGDRESGAASVDYTAEGATVTVTATHTLEDIAELINKGTYADGNAITASVVDRQLVIAGDQTGVKHVIALSDTSGTVLQDIGVLDGVGAINNSMQTARDASFSINGISITRASNTGLTDVLTGVTLNLKADSGGESATLTIARNNEKLEEDITGLVEQFNTFQGYLATQTSSIEIGENSYSRGALANDSTFTSLRYNLFNDLGDQVSGLSSGAPTSLLEIGITLDSSLTASIDESELTAALAENRSGVQEMLEAVADRIQARLESLNDSSTGVIEINMDRIDDELFEISSRVTSMNTYLDAREVTLVAQYAQIQGQIGQMIYIQQQMSAFGGGSLNLYG